MLYEDLWVFAELYSDTGVRTSVMSYIYSLLDADERVVLWKRGCLGWIIFWHVKNV